MSSFPENGRYRGYTLSRLAGFSDSVISIAITILVLGLEVPSVHEVNEHQLVDFLRATIVPAWGFVVSFVVIGTYWLEHYAIFHYLTHATRMLVVLNAWFLLCLVFLPFPTGLQAAYRHDELAMALYGSAQLMCGLSLLVMWLYAINNRHLIRANVSAEVIQSMTRRLTIAPALSLLAIGCSFVSIPFSKVIFLAIPVFYMSHSIVDSGWQKPESKDVD